MLRSNWVGGDHFAFGAWTDGAAQTEAPFYGVGGGCLWTPGVRRLVKEDQAQAAGANCTSFRAEYIGILTALQMILVKCLAAVEQQQIGRVRNGVVLICTDGQEMIKALQKGPLLQSSAILNNIWWHLLEIVRVAEIRAVVVQWVPGHVGLSCNEQVDAFVEQQFQPLLRNQIAAPAAIEGVKVAVRRSMRTPWTAGDAGMHWLGVG